MSEILNKPDASKILAAKMPEVKLDPRYKSVYSSLKGYQVEGALFRPDKLGFFSPVTEAQKAFCEKKVQAKEFNKF